MWKDLETKTDLVNHRGIAAAIVGLIRDDDLTPLTIGVHGDWGSGKSTVLEMVRTELVKHDKIALLAFNGWLFQGFEDAKIALMEAIVGELERDARWTEKIKSGAVRLLKRVNWLKVARKATVAALAVPTAGGSLLVDNVVDHVRDAVSDVPGDDAWLKDAEDRDVTRQIHAFRDEFRKLLNEAGIEQLVIVVDDLDRCLPSVAVETLEALRLFLFVEGTVFIIAADEAMIEYAVRQHFPGLPYSEGPAAFTRNYLEKLIQVPFRLPPMNVDEARSYISLLFIEAALRPHDGAFGTLLDAIIASRKHAWESLPVDAVTIAQHLPADVIFDERLREQLLIAGRVARTLASGSKGNPRQIKRFLNTLALRSRLAAAYGLAEEIDEGVLAKLMLLERFNPTLYRALAEIIGSTKNGTVPGIDRVADVDEKERDIPDVLAKSSAFFEWTHIEPPLRDVDLRPYLFISREYAPGYVGESGYPDLPQALVRRFLDTSPLEEAALGRELTALPAERAERLLDLGLTQLRGRPELSELDGLLRGIGVLCRAQPHLQTTFLEALDEYPARKIAPFMPIFLRSTITSDALIAKQLAILEDRWNAEGSAELQEAIIVGRRRRKQ